MTGKVEAYVNKDSHQRVPKKTSRERGSVPVSPLTLSCTSRRSPRSRSREEWWPGVSILYYFHLIKLIKNSSYLTKYSHLVPKSSRSWPIFTLITFYKKNNIFVNNRDHWWPLLFWHFPITVWAVEQINYELWSCELWNCELWNCGSDQLWQQCERLPSTHTPVTESSGSSRWLPKTVKKKSETREKSSDLIVLAGEQWSTANQN